MNDCETLVSALRDKARRVGIQPGPEEEATVLLGLLMAVVTSTVMDDDVRPLRGHGWRGPATEELARRRACLQVRPAKITDGTMGLEVVDWTSGPSVVGTCSADQLGWMDLSRGVEALADLAGGRSVMVYHRHESEGEPTDEIHLMLAKTSTDRRGLWDQLIHEMS